MSIASACAGKSLSEGGLNKEQLIALLKNFGVKESTVSTREKAESALCEKCKDLNIAAGLLQHIDYDGVSYLYKGKKASVEVTWLAEGGFGEVYKVIITDGSDKIPFVHKIGRKRALDELQVIKSFPHYVSCANIMSMKACADRRSVIMPLALGDLFEFKGLLTCEQMSKVITIVREALLCLAGKGIYYFDIKSENVLIGCGSENGINVYLADMGSTLPDKGGWYTTSYPLVDADHHTDPEEVNVKGYYDFQLALMYLMMHAEAPVMNQRDKPYWALTPDARLDFIENIMRYIPSDDPFKKYMKSYLLLLERWV